ncbi:MAG: glutathione S-transferase N-terminal domain-containing protein [Myxococcales bacterium]
MPADVQLRLTGRSSSHFTRVARIVAHELRLPLELRVAHELMSLDTAAFGGHPALKLPTLHIGEAMLFGTDNICRRLAELASRGDDPSVVLSHRLTSDLSRNAQELVWHSMAAQVQLVIGVQLAKLPAENVYFSKAAAGLQGALGWLDERLEQVRSELPPSRCFSVFEVTLFCLLEHLAFRPTVQLDELSNLRGFAREFAARDSARRTVYRFDPPPNHEENP